MRNYKRVRMKGGCYFFTVNLAKRQGNNLLVQQIATLREAFKRTQQDHPFENKFGQGKNGYRLNYIRAKRADTSLAWINSIFLVMNLFILVRIFFVLCKKSLFSVILLLKQVDKLLSYNSQPNPQSSVMSCEKWMLTY